MPSLVELAILLALSVLGALVVAVIDRTKKPKRGQR